MHEGQIEEIPDIVEEGQANWAQLEVMLTWLRNEGLTVEDLKNTTFDGDFLEELREAVFDE
jgi:hypothetical protein